MDLRELRSLVALADSGSLTKSADRVHLSAAAVHRQLKVLEEELGLRLYEREGRQLKLTQAAEMLLPMVRNLLAQYEAVRSAVTEWKGLERGVVRIGTGPTFSTYILPSLLEEFREKYPEVELLVETGHTPQLIELLRNGLIDFVFIVYSGTSDSSQLEVVATWDFEVVLVASRQHSPPSRPHLAELQKFPFVLYKKESIFENIIDRYFADHDFRPRVTMRLDNAEPIKAMLHSGFGISMLPLWTVDAELKNKTLRFIRQREPSLTTKLALVARKRDYLSQPVKAFIEMARHWQWKKVRLMNRNRSGSQSHSLS